MYYCICFVSTGYRSVSLKNGFSENIELASLLIHINVKQAGVRKHTQHRSMLTYINLRFDFLLWGCVFVTVFVTLVIQKVEEELYSSSSQLRKKQSELTSETFLYDTHTNLQRSTIPRQHNHLMREYSTSEKQRSAINL